MSYEEQVKQLNQHSEETHQLFAKGYFVQGVNGEQYLITKVVSGTPIFSSYQEAHDQALKLAEINTDPLKEWKVHLLYEHKGLGPKALILAKPVLAPHFSEAMRQALEVAQDFIEEHPSKQDIEHWSYKVRPVCKS